MTEDIPLVYALDNDNSNHVQFQGLWKESEHLAYGGNHSLDLHPVIGC